MASAVRINTGRSRSKRKIENIKSKAILIKYDDLTVNSHRKGLNLFPAPLFAFFDGIVTCFQTLFHIMAGEFAELERLINCNFQLFLVFSLLSQAFRPDHGVRELVTALFREIYFAELPYSGTE
jgi:hypothetical protein